MNEPDVRRLVEAFWRAFLETDAHGPAASADLVTPGVTFRGTLGIAVEGAEGITAYCRQARGVFRDFDIAVGEVIAQGGLIAARLTFSGVHQKELFGVPPSGRRMEYDGMAWMRLEGGRFADLWVMGDAAEWMTRFRALQG
jgi:predicted ester cyclase